MDEGRERPVRRLLSRGQVRAEGTGGQIQSKKTEKSKSGETLRETFKILRILRQN